MNENSMSESLDYTPDYCRKHIAVLGCGNVLFGDDGFGPAVIDYLLSGNNFPENACLVNAGSSVREILFNIMLSQQKPRQIIIVDTMSCGQEPGTIMELDLDLIPVNKRDDFSMHQIPTSNLLRELRDACGIGVRLIVFEPYAIPPEVAVGLSPGAVETLTEAARRIMDMCTTDSNTVMKHARSE